MCNSLQINNFTTMKILKEIALAAQKKGICKEWFSDMLKQDNIKPFCDMYFKGNDWAMEQDFPSLEMIRNLKTAISQHGLIVDFKGSLDNQKQLALFGNSDAQLVYNEFYAGVLIVRHDSKVTIKASGNAFLVVDVLDNANVTIEAMDNAKVIVSQYGNSKINAVGNVDIKLAKWQK